MTKRLHGGRTTEQHVLDLQKNGWGVTNIASIAGVSAQTVREILRRKNIIMD